MNLQANITITYEAKRCDECGAFWAIEQPRQWNSVCPCCAGREIEKHRVEKIKLERSNRSLKAFVRRN